MELDLSNFSCQRINVACIVDTFLATCFNLASLSETTAAFSHKVRVWSDCRKSQSGAWGKRERFPMTYLHFINSNTQGRILNYAKSFAYINKLHWDM